MLGERHIAGDLELDVSRYQLRRDGRVLRIEKIPMELFIFLVENKDNLVSREAIVERLWGKDVFLDTEQGINTAVRKIRQALHDDPERPRFLQTVVGKGYRFVGPLRVIGNGNLAAAAREPILPSAVAPLPPEENRDEIPSWWKSKTLLGSLLALALAVLGIWYLLGVHSRSQRPAIHSIAVLPLQNLSGDPGQEYFADGTTEELITTLAKLTDLRVISRTSAMRMKGVQKSIREIGGDLGVDAVVEGSVARSPQTIRITVQLIDVSSDRHLWAEEYEGPPSDIFQLQQKVALAIASLVSAKIAPQQEAHVRGPKSVNPEAHNLYLKARSYAAHGTPESLTKSLELYQQAIAIQPDYAAAYSGMAASYCNIASGWDDPHVFFPRAREAALKALSLDNAIPGARTELAWLKHAYDWDTAGAEAEFQTAMKLNGYDADTHSAYAMFLADTGRYDQGLAEARRAEDLDPLSLNPSVAAERVLMRGRRFEEFLKQAERSRKLDPTSVPTTYRSVIVYENLGRFEDAIHEDETHPYDRTTQTAATAEANRLRAILRKEGPKGYWQEALRECLKPPADDHWHTAHAYFMLGNNEAGLRELELTVQQHDPSIRFDIKNSPWWDPVRNDPRFQELLRKVGY